jgi:hypothetical protein
MIRSSVDFPVEYKKGNTGSREKEREREVTIGTETLSTVKIE